MEEKEKQVHEKDKDIQADQHEASTDQQDKENIKDESLKVESEDEKKKEEKSLSEELDELKDRHMRLQAEYQNFRQRTQREKQDIYRYANEKIIVDLLPFLDNFDRAIAMVKDAKNPMTMAEGISQLKKRFMDFLKEEGVKEVDATGEFDPNKHHAVMTEEKEGVDEGQILEVLQKGYEYKERVIRPTMVKVAK